MRIARVLHPDGSVLYGRIDGDGDGSVFVPLRDPPFSNAEPRATDAISLAMVQLLAPVVPSKILGFGRNFPPARREPHEEPSFFFKPPSAIVADGATIRLPRAARGGALFEAELAVVIGHECRDVLAAEFADVVFGYTVANDVSGLDLDVEPAGHYPVKAKAYDTFCPLGPWIETELDPLDVGIGCIVNGQERQASRTSGLITSVPDLVAIASGVMTMYPGDVILTGTPPGLSPLRDGDCVEAWVEGIGSLRNTVTGPR
jgi:2-keto-4-pentenoate hydratase/2-oxohepta-3-ene-1,7-dioic acid hydratase in catechol pathway